MDQFEQLIRFWEACSYDTLVANAKEAGNYFADACKAAGIPLDGRRAAQMIATSACLADGEICDKERQLIEQALGAFDEEFLAFLAEMEAQQDPAALLQAMAELGEDAAPYIMTLHLAAMAADGTINEQEQAFLQDFFN